MTEKFIWVRRPLRFKVRCCLEGKSLKSKEQTKFFILMTKRVTCLLLQQVFKIKRLFWNLFFQKDTKRSLKLSCYSHKTNQNSILNSSFFKVVYDIYIYILSKLFSPLRGFFFYHFVSFSDLFSCTTLRFTKLLDKLTWVLHTVARMTFRVYFTSSAGLTASVIWEDAASLISRPSGVLATSNTEENMVLHEVCLSRFFQ